MSLHRQAGLHCRSALRVWRYNTCSEIQGLLIARVSGRTLPEFLAERVFEPLGMGDTGFHVPADKLDRLPLYRGPDLTPIENGLLTQLQMTGPTPTPIMREFWRYAFG
jgi:CubicO group peptidase (beta-lactamase class C family)